MTYYFAYGSNMNPERMIERNVRFDGFESAFIKNAKLKFSKKSYKEGEGFANIHFNFGNNVEGILYQLKSRFELNKLDRFEGYPFHYSRVEMLVHTINGYKKAFVYIARPEMTRKKLRPSREYLNHLLSAKELLSQNYFKKLEATQCI